MLRRVPTRNLIALSVAAALASPLSAALPSGTCDYLIVADSLFLPQAQRLSDLRHRLTPGVAAHPCVASMPEVYHAYPPTGLRWTSLRDYLAARWRDAPGELKHVVLLGDASFQDDAPANHVPVFQQRIFSAVERGTPGNPAYDTLSSDDAFTCFFDSVTNSDSLAPRFAIGRIPAGTRAQAEAYLDKVEAYESAYPFGPQAFTYGYLSDDDIQHGSIDDMDPIWDLSEQHFRLWDALPVKPFVKRLLSIEFPIQPDWSKPAARDSLIRLFNTGPARVYFIGHGHPHQLTDERIFLVPDDLTGLRPKPVQPMVAMLSCTTARFGAPGTVMGKELLFHPHGAISFLGGTIPTYPSPNLNLGHRLDSVAALGGTLGQAVLKAKHDAFYAQNTAAYVLLGDPALTLRAPAFDLAPALGSGAGRLVLEAAGTPGDSAYFQLVRIDSLPWNAVIQAPNTAQRDRLYPRETVVGEGRAVLGAGGNVTFTLPPTGDPRASAVKVMAWNSRGMRYGHFPLASLMALAVRTVPGPAHAQAGYRLRVRGGELILEGRGRVFGLDGRQRPGRMGP
jgi:hypothetical protein